MHELPVRLSVRPDGELEPGNTYNPVFQTLGFGEFRSSVGSNTLQGWRGSRASSLSHDENCYTPRGCVRDVSFLHCGALRARLSDQRAM